MGSALALRGRDEEALAAHERAAEVSSQWRFARDEIYALIIRTPRGSGRTSSPIPLRRPLLRRSWAADAPARRSAGRVVL